MTNERIMELAKQLEDIMEELNANGIIGGIVEGKHGSKDYYISLQTDEAERIPCSLGVVSYEKFLNEQVKRNVRVGKVLFDTILTKKEAKKIMEKEMFA